MTITTDRNNIITILPIVSLVMVVMSRLLAASEADEIGGFRHPSESHSLVHQASSRNLRGVFTSLLLIPTSRNFGALLRVVLRPFHSGIELPLSKLRVGSKPCPTIGGIVSRRAGFALAPPPMEPSRLHSKLVQWFDFTAREALFFHARDNSTFREKINHSYV